MADAAAQAAAQLGLGGPPPGGAPAAVVFALSPATVSQAIIDYNTKQGQVIYGKNTESLPIYDLSGGGLSSFLKNVKDRSSEAGWMDTLQVACLDGTTRDFFANYGTITMEDVQAHAATYIGQQTRDAQNSYQMQVCFKKSLTDEAKLTVESTPNNYTITGHIDGVSYLKSIVQAAIVDTRFTNMTIREKLHELPSHMNAVDHIVTSFNTDVKNWSHQLLARNDPMSDSELTLNLLHGYKANADVKFHDYISRVNDDYLDGTRNLSPDQLMLLADNKYKQLTQLGEWMEPSPDQKRIVALTAELHEVKKHAAKGKPPDANPGNGGKRRRQYPEWKIKEPKENEPKTKTVKGKTYYWCPYHKLWTEHKPADCRKKPSDTPTETNGKLNLSPALANIAAQDEGDGYSSA